ncbi:hypothetical protein EYF80_014241 [Liparis tanakae]|uniref:Uncharacterized protein n=1 Tax=Liparis tanakae TaxID=230148 RepID=A0A4Z2IBL5_9TELE|nr:hypothetical protein EYF80_014241 [Liparis tanakae]
MKKKKNHDGGDESAHGQRGGVQARERGRLAAPVQPRVQLPAARVVEVRRVDLTQGAAGQKHVEHLMALSHEIAPPGEAALQQGEGEEEGAAEEEADLAEVVHDGRVVAAAAARRPRRESFHHGAAVPRVGERRRHHLAHLTHPRREAVVAVLTVAAAQARQAAEEGGGGHEDAAHVPVQALVHGVVEVDDGAAVLVLRHPDVVQEEEEVVPHLGLAAQQVGRGAERRVGQGGQEEDQQRPRVTVAHEVHGLAELPEFDQED